MTSIVIFALEGVLQSAGGRPVEAGCRLYRTLRSSLLYQVGVISAAGETTARRFFDHQHLAAPTFINWSEADPDDWTDTCMVLRRAYPYDIDLIIVPDPAIAAELYHEGFRTMLWTDPRYSRPEHRPDARPPGASSWAKLASGLASDRDLIAADDRITPR